MADTKTNTTPVTAPVTTPANISIPLPAGMTVEQFQKSMSSFFKMADYTKKHDKAKREADKKLEALYPAKYKELLAAELKLVGITSKK